jgi:hypothetical protein
MEKWNPDAARQQLEWARMRTSRFERDHKLLTATLKRAVKCVESGVPERIPGIVRDALGKLEATC